MCPTTPDSNRIAAGEGAKDSANDDDDLLSWVTQLDKPQVDPRVAATAAEWTAAGDLPEVFDLEEFRRTLPERIAKLGMVLEVRVQPSEDDDNNDNHHRDDDNNDDNSHAGDEQNDGVHKESDPDPRRPQDSRDEGAEVDTTTDMETPNTKDGPAPTESEFDCNNNIDENNGISTAHDETVADAVQSDATVAMQVHQENPVPPPENPHCRKSRKQTKPQRLKPVQEQEERNQPVSTTTTTGGASGSLYSSQSDQQDVTTQPPCKRSCRIALRAQMAATEATSPPTDNSNSPILEESDLEAFTLHRETEKLPLATVTLTTNTTSTETSTATDRGHDDSTNHASASQNSSLSSLSSCSSGSVLSPTFPAPTVTQKDVGGRVARTRSSRRMQQQDSTALPALEPATTLTQQTPAADAITPKRRRGRPPGKRKVAPMLLNQQCAQDSLWDTVRQQAPITRQRAHCTTGPTTQATVASTPEQDSNHPATTGKNVATTKPTARTSETADGDNARLQDTTPPKRGRGRPRKYPKTSTTSDQDCTTPNALVNTQQHAPTMDANQTPSTPGPTTRAARKTAAFQDQAREQDKLSFSDGSNNNHLQSPMPRRSLRNQCKAGTVTAKTNAVTPCCESTSDNQSTENTSTSTAQGEGVSTRRARKRKHEETQMAGGKRLEPMPAVSMVIPFRCYRSEKSIKHRKCDFYDTLGKLRCDPEIFNWGKEQPYDYDKQQGKAFFESCLVKSCLFSEGDIVSIQFGREVYTAYLASLFQATKSFVTKVGDDVEDVQKRGHAYARLLYLHCKGSGRFSLGIMSTEWLMDRNLVMSRIGSSTEWLQERKCSVAMISSVQNCLSDRTSRSKAAQQVQFVSKRQEQMYLELTEATKPRPPGELSYEWAESSDDSDGFDEESEAVGFPFKSN